MFNAILYVILAAVIIGGLTTLYLKIDAGGYNRCTAEVAISQKEKDDEVKKIKKQVRHETQSLDRAGIVARLCARGWVREQTGCPAK